MLANPIPPAASANATARRPFHDIQDALLAFGLIATLSLGMGWGLAACSDKSSQIDDRLKARLVGTWEYQSRDTAGRFFNGQVQVDRSGRFQETILIRQASGQRTEKWSGQWQIAPKSFQLQSTQRNGEPLEAGQQRVLNCRIESPWPLPPELPCILEPNHISVSLMQP